MNVLLIQPPDPPELVAPRGLGGRWPPPLVPPWELLCLEAHLNRRSGHVTSLLDARFLSALEPELVAAVQSLAEPRLAVLNTSTAALGHVMGLLDILKRHFPRLPTALCGQHPSQFPESASRLPRADYVLAGDPEPILLSLLDFYHVKTRLKRVPGLIFSGSEISPPYWLPDLNSLTLPEWQESFLAPYAQGPNPGGCVVWASLSRGHTRCPADRAFGSASEPLRLWKMDRMASCMQKASGKGVREFFLADPPGVWTPSHLDQWCEALCRARNTIPWGLQLLPTFLSPDTVDQMRRSGCRRVVLLFPSCDRKNLQKYGCILGPRDLASTVRSLEQAGLQVHLEVWMGGPEERRGERGRAIRLLKALGFPPFTLHPFPCRLDAPLCRELEPGRAPDPDEWVRWALDPWNQPRPHVFWNKETALPRLTAEFSAVVRNLESHPRRLLKKTWLALRTGRLFRPASENVRVPV